MIGVQPASATCPAIDGIIEEANDVAGDVADKNVLDAALIAAAQAVEHYEMTRYGSLIAWAKTLGRSDCAQVSAGDSGGGEGRRREADLDRRERREPSSGLRAMRTGEKDRASSSDALFLSAADQTYD